MIKNTFLLLVIVAAALFSFSTYDAYATVFTKIDSIEGDVTAAGFEKDIEISSFQFGVNIPAPSASGGGGPGHPTFADLVITKNMDKSSVPLAKDLLSGNNIPTMDIFLVKSGPKGLIMFAHYALENVLISSYQVSSGGDLPTESIGFNYAKLTTEFIPQNPDGSSGTPITFCWDNIANKECTATNSVPPAPPGSFNDPSNGGTVTPCPAGTFTDTAGQSACTPAPAGSFATGPGATSATLCPAGTFSSTPGSASCTSAPPGSYVPTTGATSATLCPAGTYCPNPGTVTPLTCPVHYFCGVGTVTPLPEIESITPTTGGSQVTFNTGAGGFTNLNAINPTSLPTPPPPGSYPFGLFSFSIIGFAPATSDTITITYPNPIMPGTQYLKFVGGTWIAAPFTSSGNAITITIIDNGVLDSNPAIGTISDPGGILATTPGKVTGGGSIGKNTEFGLDANTGDDSKKIQGDIEYQNKTAHINFHGHKIQLLSIDSTQTQATIIGTGTFDIKDHEDDKKKAPPAQFTFLVTVVDPDKKGIHDQLTITIFDATNKVVYHDAGTVKGHIEIHKSTEHNGHENDKGKSEK